MYVYKLTYFYHKNNIRIVQSSVVYLTFTILSAWSHIYTIVILMMHRQLWSSPCRGNDSLNIYKFIVNFK